jgi:hypothetical protein
VADTKYTSNIQPLFKHAKEIADKRSNTMIADGTHILAILNVKKGDIEKALSGLEKAVEIGGDVHIRYAIED